VWNCGIRTAAQRLFTCSGIKYPLSWIIVSIYHERGLSSIDKANFSLVII